MTDYSRWEKEFQRFLHTQEQPGDAAHDLAHIRRVVRNAKQLAASEQAQLAIVIPAAWLHDCVIVPKNSPQRSQASRLAAEEATEYLTAVGYPTQHIKVVQDADRLDAIGAVGLARTLMLGGSFGSQLYHPEDPLAKQRELNDNQYVIDHFFAKLLKLETMMQTEAGKKEAGKRTAVLRDFLAQLRDEVGW